MERDVETGSQTLLESLADLYTGQAAIRGDIDPAPMRGCLVLTSALNCTPQNVAVAAWSAGYRARIWEAITSRFERAAFEGEIGGTPSVKAAVVVPTGCQAAICRG